MGSSLLQVTKLRLLLALLPPVEPVLLGVVQVVFGDWVFWKFAVGLRHLQVNVDDIVGGKRGVISILDLRGSPTGSALVLLFMHSVVVARFDIRCRFAR